MERVGRECIIGIAGRARTGKSTAAAYLQAEYGLYPMAFAEPIKRGLRAMIESHEWVFEESRKEHSPFAGLPVSMRELMQRLGDWGREIHPDFWVRAAMARWTALCAAFDTGMASPGVLCGAVFADVRYENEAFWIRSQGGFMIHLRRESASAVRPHSSEGLLPVHDDDVVLSNGGTVDALYAKLDIVMMDRALCDLGLG